MPSFCSLMEYTENGERAAIHSVIPMSPSKHFRDPIDLAPRQALTHLPYFYRLLKAKPSL